MDGETQRMSTGNREMLLRMPRDELQTLIDSYHWHHSIDFGNGLRTKTVVSEGYTRDFAAALFSNLNLTGTSLMDVGAWTGGYSFIAKQSGASRVVASDKFVWTHPHYRGREAFELARSLLNLTVEAHEVDLPHVTPETAGVFDTVLFSGVFYHLINPVHLMRQIGGCARHLLIVETHQDALDVRKPAMIFYPGATLHDDPTNWWGPNPHCMYEILSELGFAEILYRDTPGFTGHSRGIYQAFRSRDSRLALGSEALPAPWVSLSDPAARTTLFEAAG